jgi:hypothetical protein
MASIDGQDLVAERMLSPATDHGNSARALRWATRTLVSTFWVSAVIFGLYIISFYVGALSDGSPERWNESLPRLYDPVSRSPRLQSLHTSQLGPFCFSSALYN